MKTVMKLLFVSIALLLSACDDRPVAKPVVSVATPVVSETLSVTATLTWTAPTTNTDGSAITNLAGYEIFASTSPIPDDPAGPPALTPGHDVTGATYTATVPNGSTLYFRMRSCNTEAACSVLTPEQTVVAKVPEPGVPEGVAVTVTVVVVVK